MDIFTVCVQLITAFLGAFGYSLLYRIDRRNLFWAPFGGFLAWLLYLVCGAFVTSDVIRYFLASAAVTFYAEFMARKRRTPATVFLAPATIPMIPGGSLYQTLAYFFHAAWKEAFFQGLQTLLLAAAISGGILMTMTILQVLGLKQRAVQS